MKNVPEILAPAGNADSLIAAVRSGADAVYLGTMDFNARRNAGNFDDEGLKEAVRYCHIRGVKVYVTFNTLITDKELVSAAQSLEKIALSGADAIIVQDLAAAKMAKEICPHLALHASTQMSVTNIYGIKALEELGFKRVVLARELSFDEIKDICRSTSMEIEMFVHGALCSCVSGMCYMSSVIGQRSGNRGLCAQPCRLDMRIKNVDHALSLKDMSYIEHIGDLASIGVKSLKIEGRMKRPEYVAAAVSECKRALCGEKPDMMTLKNVFSRGGFTDGYYTGKRDINMHGYRTKEDVVSFDAVKKRLQGLFSKETPRVLTHGLLRVKKDEATSYSFSDGKNEVTVCSGVPSAAEKRSLDHGFAYSYLKKLGSTPYVLEDFEFDSDEGLYLGIPELNALKNAAAEKLSALRAESGKKTVTKITDPLSRYEKHVSDKTGYILRFEDHEQFFGIADDVFYYVFRPAAIEEHPELISQCGERLAAEMPAVTFQSDVFQLKKRLELLKAKGVKTVSAGNICDIRLAREIGFNVIGSFMLNVTNSISLDSYHEMGVDDVCVSFELGSRAISCLKGNARRGAMTYGRLPLMRFRRCPARNNGCGKCNGINSVTDEKNKRFLLLCSEKKYSTLYNHIPLYSADKKIENCDAELLYFTLETGKTAKEIYLSAIKRKSVGFERTNGLYYRKLL